MSDHEPGGPSVNDDTVQMMQSIATLIDKYLNDDVMPSKFGFLVLACEFSTPGSDQPGRTYFVSNINRDDQQKMLQGQLEFMQRQTEGRTQ